MTTRHLVDPDLLMLVDLFPAGPITQENLAETRAAMDARFDDLPRPAIAPVRHFAPGRDGAPDVPLLVYDPGGVGLRAAILHIHGGGMISGRPELTVFGSAPIALGLGLVVISVEYRLAPEVPFPGPQEDCYAALDWVHAQAAALRIDPARIAVSGDSAGGGLAAALTLMARDRGGPRIAAQLLTYPMLDPRTGGPDDPYRNPVAGEFLWTRDRNCFGWQALRGTAPIDPAQLGWFAPALASDLSDLPPAFIGTGALDLFVDENLDYARRLIAAGVAVDLHCYPGAVHGFNALPKARVTARFNADYAHALALLIA